MSGRKHSTRPELMPKVKRKAIRSKGKWVKKCPKGEKLTNRQKKRTSGECQKHWKREKAKRTRKVLETKKRGGLTICEEDKEQGHDRERLGVEAIIEGK